MDTKNSFLFLFGGLTLGIILGSISGNLIICSGLGLVTGILFTVVSQGLKMKK